MSQTLQGLLQEIGPAELDGDAEVAVAGLTYDSHKVRAGDLFIAVRGARQDGNRFAATAVERGAVAVLSASSRQPGTAPAAWVRVPDERLAMARAAAAFHGHPDRQLALTAITGTNGKTTTAWLLEAILAAAGRRPGLLGTVAHRWPGREEEAARTTPEAPDLHRLLRCMADAGCGDAVMEVSSHALALRRVEGMRFRTAVFTNLSRDHLDFHGDPESYFEAKARLFDALEPEAAAVLNADDPRSDALARRTRARVVTFGTRRGDVLLREFASAFDGTEATVATPAGEVRLRSSLPGGPNRANLLAAAAAAWAQGIGLEAIAAGVGMLRGVPGRFERVDAGQSFQVIVDFAHTDDALRNVLAAVRELSPARVITVFGCGGDRDRGKRPRMGEAAAMGSDVVILTSDNPRREDPERIATEAEAGARDVLARGEGKCEFHRQTDRREAIRLALSLARAGDAVVIAGKGHERGQIIGDRVVPFDDRKVCLDLLQERLAGGG